MRHSLAQLLVFGLVLLARAGHAAGNLAEEGRARAAFLYNIARFVHWPEPTTGQPADRLVVCVAGDDLGAGILARQYGDKTVQGRPLSAKTVASPDEARGCHMLYISHWKSKEAKAWLSSVGQAPVLTISDMPEFLNLGGIVVVSLDGLRVTFEINRDAALRTRLGISSHILRIASSVISGGSR